MAIAKRKPAAPRKTPVRKSSPAAPKTISSPVPPEPLTVWKTVAKIIVESAAADPSGKKRDRQKHLMEEAVRNWDEHLFAKFPHKGKKKALKATRQLIKTAVDCAEIISEKLHQEKPAKPKVEKKTKAKIRAAKTGKKAS